MASKSFDGGPSSGQSFEQQSNGVSAHEVPDPFSGQSMAGGNATTEPPAFGAAGSASESLELVANPNVTDFGDLGHVSTALAPDVPETDTSNNRVQG